MILEGLVKKRSRVRARGTRVNGKVCVLLPHDLEKPRVFTWGHNDYVIAYRPYTGHYEIHTLGGHVVATLDPDFAEDFLRYTLTTELRSVPECP